MCQEIVQQPSVLLDLLLQLPVVLTTLLAAFAGAWFAFYFQNKREEKKENDRNLATLDFVQISLIQQLNALTILKKDHVSKVEELPEELKWLAIPALPEQDYSQYKIKNESLIFLAEKGYPELIQKILIAEEAFYLVFQIVNTHSDFHVSRLQDKLEEVGWVEGEGPGCAPEELQEKVGHRIVTEKRRMTNDLVKCTESAITLHDDVIGEIYRVGKKIFPDKKIVTLQGG